MGQFFRMDLYFSQNEFFCVSKWENYLPILTNKILILTKIQILSQNVASIGSQYLIPDWSTLENSENFSLLRDFYWFTQEKIMGNFSESWEIFQIIFLKVRILLSKWETFSNLEILIRRKY